ncbi:MAG: hypothetical protein ACFFD1_14590 [Candidatus Thorarchaeota archaeon]
MILSKIIINSRGQIVYENPEFTLLSYDSPQFEELKLYLFSLDLSEEILQIKPPKTLISNPNVSILLSKHFNDVFVIFDDNYLGNLKEYTFEFQIMINLRQEQIERFRGILFVDFDDSYGPEVRYNAGFDLGEEDALRIGLQCFTTLGIGSGGEFQSGFHGPIVFKELGLALLIYAFIRPAPESSDSRIKRAGRPSTIILLYQNSVDADNKLVKTFVETVLQRSKLNEDASLTTEKLSDILDEIKEITSFALDLTEVERVYSIRLKERLKKLEDKVEVLSKQNDELKDENKKLRNLLNQQ